MAIRIRPGWALVTCIANALPACSLKHEQEPGSSAKGVQPVVSVNHDDAGQPGGVYLSVLVKFEGDAITVEKINRVQGGLHKRRGLRQRRGLLVLAQDASGKPVYREVVHDPRSAAPEYVSDGGALRRAASGAGPDYVLVRVPLATRRLLIHDARQGALDGEPTATDPQQAAEPASTGAYPLITTLELEVP